MCPLRANNCARQPRGTAELADIDNDFMFESFLAITVGKICRTVAILLTNDSKVSRRE